MNAEISEQELSERVALLKRFRELLAAQRDKFQNYLAILERQQSSIETDNMEQLTACTKLEEQLSSELYTIQKVIDPIELMYRDSYGSTNAGKEIPSLKTDLVSLQKKVQEQNKKNRVLLETHMEDIRSKMQTLAVNPYFRRTGNYYKQAQATAHLIDIRQ